MLRVLLATAARDDDEPPPPPSDHPAGDTDFLRIEIDRWNNGNSNQLDQARAQLDHVRPQLDQARAQLDHIRPQLDHVTSQFGQIRPQLDQLRAFDDDDEKEEHIDNQNEEEEAGDDEEDTNDDDDDDINNDDEDDVLTRRRLRDALRIQLRGVANLAARRRNRMLDWAEILMRLEDQPIGFRLQVSGDDDAYVGNPGDYVDVVGYEALLQRLAESDTGGRRGAPPAAKSAVEGLVTVEVKSSDGEVCAICKDLVFDNEGKVVKKLECGHMYHGECIVTWLGSKNSCPVCRFELPTDDPEYEEDRKKRLVTVNAVSDRGCSSGSGGAD
ncbi:uncharacterized protein LOC143563249 [Bidens hawaiensis]|uniref:uncharacterized protein LOC143563249 n=1 Tax=Bidens hawaiensis TaxID=980011 RepID=UPI00404A0203